MNTPSLKANGVKFSQYLLLNTFKPADFLKRSFSQSNSLMQNPEKNPYFEKYAAKLAEARKMPKKVSNMPPADIQKSIDVKPSSFKSHVEENPNNKKDLNGCFQMKKDLNQIMKLDTIREKSAQEIESIWKEYHKVKHGVYAVLPAKSFEKIYFNLKKFPVFLFPLPRAHGYEFVMCQFLDQSCYFTSLINYQAFKENAPICLTVTYFTELMKEKDIVLMRGEFDNSLQPHEAQCLVNQLQLYYSSQDEEKNKLLSNFNDQPETFDHMDLISTFESTFQTGLINAP